jgi:hypothetical protein
VWLTHVTRSYNHRVETSFYDSGNHPNCKINFAVSPYHCQNRFNGTVKEFIYLGDHVRVRMAVGGNPDFMIKVPVAQLHASLQVGAPVPVGWNIRDIRALDVI